MGQAAKVQLFRRDTPRRDELKKLPLSSPEAAVTSLMFHLRLCDLGVLSGENFFSALSARMLSVEPLFDKTYLRIVFDESN